MYRKKWTKKDVEYIQKNAKTKMYQEIAKDLNRSKISIERKMNRLGIKPTFLWNTVWTYDKIKYLKDNAKNNTYEEMASNLNTTKSSIVHKMLRLKIKPKKHPKFKSVNHAFFKTWSEEMAYIFGYWFADGNVSSHGKRKFNSDFAFNISSKDIDILKKIQLIISSTYAICKGNKIINGKNFCTYSLVVYSKEIYGDIIKLGGCERKSLKAKFPTIPKQYVRHFIRGYFDGDGCIRKIKSHGNYSSINFLGTYDFLSSLMMYFPYRTEIKTINHAKQTYQINYNAEDAQIILQFMYLDSIIYLQRKYDRYKETMQWQRNKHPWTESELQTLKEKYPIYGTDISNLLQTHTVGSISVKSSELGIRRI